MRHDEVARELIGVLRGFQEDVSEDAGEITEDTQPIGDLAGFDSLAGIAATVQCLTHFGLADREDVQNLFVGEDAKGNPFARAVGQVAEHVVQLLSEKTQRR